MLSGNTIQSHGNKKGGATKKEGKSGGGGEDGKAEDETSTDLAMAAGGLRGATQSGVTPTSIVVVQPANHYTKSGS